MADPVWGQLAKAQDDAQTIEQAIDAAIAAHNDDPDAHLAAGQSIDVHRTNEMIDHPAGSVAVDKFSNAILLMTSFESVDAWLTFFSGSGAKTLAFGSLQLYTGATSASVATLWTVPVTFQGFDPNKAFMWRSTLSLSATTAQTVYWGLGYLEDAADQDGFGYRVIDGTLVCFGAVAGSFTTHTITGYTLTDPHTYEIRYSVAGPSVEFWIDGTLEHTMTSGFPTAALDEIAAFYITNSAAALKKILLSNFFFERER